MPLKHPCMDLQVHLSLDLQLEKSNFDSIFISSEVAFSQGFFMSSDNFFTSEKFLGYGMKWESSEPDYPNGRSYEILFTTVLNDLCKPLPMFCLYFNAPFHYYCL